MNPQTLADVEALLLDVAAFAGALTVISGALAAFTRWVVLRPIGRMIAVAVSDTEARIGARLSAIEREVTPNGGGSMRDAVLRIEKALEERRVVDEKTATYARATATALTAQGVVVPLPEDFGLGSNHYTP